jgi:asparagine synthetase B (glutamine-hydrolysing)
VTFLSLGRYQVLREPAPLWVGLGFATFAIFAMFYVFSWPGLLPSERSLVVSRPDTAAWFWHLQFSALALGLLVAVFAHRPRPGTWAEHHWLRLVAAVLAASVVIGALSLAFPDPECNEESVQRGVANDLGLPQVMIPFDVAAGRDGLLMSALELCRTSAQPLLNFWLPAYMHLAAEGQQRGCTTILTGSGGDEWLGVSSYLAADLISAFDFRGLYELWRTQRKSYTTSSWSLVKDMAWYFGGKPLLTGAAVEMLRRTAPSVLDANKRRFIARTTPDWVAPEPELRRELNERAERNTGQPEFGQFYLRTMKRALDHLLPTLEVEETFDAGRRLGQRKLSPYWDADLVELLFRIPPDVLNRGGRSKGLVRQAMARRFPHLGFEAQKKVVAVNYFASVVHREWQGGWERLGGVPTLERLGIVDVSKMEPTFRELLATQQTRKYFNMWDTINLEVWARERC